MNKKLEMIGKGFVYGVKHPYLDEPMKRSDGMTAVDGFFGDIGMSLSQGAIQTLVGYGTAILVVVAVGYINSKISKKDLKVKMTVENKKDK